MVHATCLPLQAGELSAKLDPYIRTQRRDWDGESAETQIWPLIKYVEVILPKSALIPEGVVLVDIPGTGDFNSKRDEMWRKVISFRSGFPSSLCSFTRFNKTKQNKKTSWDFVSLTALNFLHFLCSGVEQGRDCTWMSTETREEETGRGGCVAGARVCEVRERQQQRGLQGHEAREKEVVSTKEAL